MISIEQISGEIAALEEEMPTHAVMQKLANLYTVRDHMILDVQPQPTAVVSDIVVAVSDSDFMQTVDGMPTNSLLKVMDELMTTLTVVNPRLYDSVMRELVP